MSNPRSGRCPCGLKVSLHYTADKNRKLTCAEAKAAHPRAKVKSFSLRRALVAAGAVLTSRG